MRITPKARFVIVVCLFAGWLGYLVFLAATSSKPVVVSRPQLLVSDVDVIAQVDALDQPVVIKEVLTSRIEESGIAIGEKVRVEHLGDCKRLPRAGEKPDAVPLDWTGPGLYLLPLTREGLGYVVTLTPPSPGFPPRDVRHVTPRIYPLSDDVLHQYHEVAPACGNDSTRRRTHETRPHQLRLGAGRS